MMRELGVVYFVAGEGGLIRGGRRWGGIGEEEGGGGRGGRFWMP